MPLESAIYINTLQPDWPTGRDPRSEGDDHLRAIKKVLQNTFPSIDGAVTGTPAQINNITLNTPWVDNSATLGASSFFNINDPTAPADEPARALLAAKAATLDDVKANQEILINWQAIANLLYPVGAKYESFTDNRNPVDILGFGTWEAVTGIIAGVGAATDSQGYTQNYDVGYHAGYWRVQDGQIVAQQLDVSLAMDAVADHVHHIQGYSDESNDGGVAAGSGDGREAGNTQGAGGHTPTGHGVVTIGAGGVADGSSFFNPYYGCYIWRRTA